jgi:FtsH-binding integral membrane protein
MSPTHTPFTPRPIHQGYPDVYGEQAAFMQRVLNNFGFTLLLAGSTAYAAWGLSPQWFSAMFVLQLVLTLVLVFSRGNGALAAPLVYAFAATTGATTVPLVQWAIRSTGETGVVYNALGISGALFMGMAWYGSATRKDLTSWSTFLSMGLLGALAVSLLGLFIGYSTVTQLVISSVIVIVFAGFTAFDLQMIKENWRSYDVHTATLTLYLDFLNLFVHVLRILVLIGRSRD